MRDQGQYETYLHYKADFDELVPNSQKLSENQHT